MSFPCAINLNSLGKAPPGARTVVDSPFHNGRGAGALFAGLFLLSGTAGAAVADFVRELTPGGELALTSDYIYRGVSESDGHVAAQGDLHLSTPGGAFLGTWASSRDAELEPGATAALEVYLGHRFALGSTWGATLIARSHYYLSANSYEPADDYQEIAAALNYLDSWSVSITCIPNALRYWFSARLSREPAWVADTSGQWALGKGFLLTAGAGYYRSQGPDSGIDRATGYGYGNAGIAWEHGAWRLDAGYFVTQEAARRLSPYPIAEHKLAGTVSLRF